MRRIEKKFVSPKICTKIKQIAYGSEKTVPREEPLFNRGLHNLMFFVFAKGQTETTASIFLRSLFIVIGVWLKKMVIILLCTQSSN